MNRPIILDLFSGAGGCAHGYQQAGFFVVGVDLYPQPRYAGDRFLQMDALEALRVLIAGGYITDTTGHHWYLSDFSVIHASPPCQFGSELRFLHQHKQYHNFIPETRRLLQATGRPYVIENVAGSRAHLISPIMLCGSSFGLRTGNAELQRHRFFEIHPFFFLAPPCCHGSENVIGIYGGHGRNRRVISVVGHSGGHSTRQASNGFTMVERNEAMGIDWMTQQELSQAIPPAYTQWIGTHLLEAIAA